MLEHVSTNRKTRAPASIASTVICRVSFAVLAFGPPAMTNGNGTAFDNDFESFDVACVVGLYDVSAQFRT